jgi:formylglycine-generating enzyme required for sulfatase activity
MIRAILFSFLIINLCLETTALSADMKTIGAQETGKSEESIGFQAFKRNVYPILQNQCTKCHSDAGPGPNHSSADPMVSYHMVQRYSNFIDIPNSKFVSKGSNGHGNGYGGNVTVTKEELVSAMTKWWAEGENKTFFEDKKVLAAKVIPVLKDDGSYTTIDWNLELADKQLSGARFSIDVQRFADKSDKNIGAYKFKNPRLVTNGHVLHVESIYFVLNGIWDSSASNYSLINYNLMTKGNAEAVLASYPQSMIEQKGPGKDTIGFAFKDLRKTTSNEKINFEPDIIAKSKSDEAFKGRKLVVLDPSVAGMASKFIKIDVPAEFEMGVTGRSFKVRLTKPFEIQATTVTQFQWYSVMNNISSDSAAKNMESRCPGNFMEVEGKSSGNIDKATGKEKIVLRKICKNNPIDNVSPKEIKNFIDNLNSMQNQYTYRLPTEAEWEYVARGGLPIIYNFPWGQTFNNSYGWSSQNASGYAHEVATRNGVPVPGDSGELIYDMYGNVLQYLADNYSRDLRDSDEKIKIDPLYIESKTSGQTTGSVAKYVYRGSHYDDDGSTAYNRYMYDGYEGPSVALGFRLARTRR